MATNTKFQLPIVDMDKAKTDRQAAGKEVVHALENIGFLYVDNIKGIDYDKLLAACKWFFNLPIQEKHAVMRKVWKEDNPNLIKGYFPVTKGETNRKEGFEFGKDVDPNDPTITPGNWFYEPNVWPNEYGTFPFKEFLQECYEILHNAGLEILRLVANGLDIDENSFDEIFDNKPSTQFRVIHYPPYGLDEEPPADAKIEGGKVVTAPDHVDMGFLTLLYIFDFTGLEVLTSNGKWESIDPRPSSWIINIGATFAHMMGGRFKATRHRVVDIGIDRYAVPFFMAPAYETDVGLNWLSKSTGEGSTHDVEKYGPWQLRRMKTVMEYFKFEDLPDVEAI